VQTIRKSTIVRSDTHSKPDFDQVESHSRRQMAAYPPGSDIVLPGDTEAMR
jgi:hypothetical protein